MQHRIRQRAELEYQRTGPRAQPGKRLAVVNEDLRNGGILSVNDGILEAAKVAGWSVKVFRLILMPSRQTEQIVVTGRRERPRERVAESEARRPSPGVMSQPSAPIRRI